MGDLKTAARALDKALDAFLDDLRMRAEMNGDVDDDGTVILPVGSGVLYRLGVTREELGRQLARAEARP